MKLIGWRQRFSSGWLIFLMALISIERYFLLSQSYDSEKILNTPNWGHWFGTDSLGRDIFWRVVNGSGVSIALGLGGAFLACLIAVLFGSIAGWYQGIADRIFMRITEVLLALPSLLITALLVYLFSDLFFKNVMLSLVIALGVGNWMSLARMLRILVIDSKKHDYIMASVALGASAFQVLKRHTLPAVAPQWGVLIVMNIPSFLLYEGFLSFVGIGVQAPSTSWGLMIQEGWRYLSMYPYLVLGPSLFLFLTVFSLRNLLQKIRSNAADL